MMPTKPRVLVFDIETKPVKAWIWRSGHKISVSHEQICKGQKFDIICICYQWLGEKTIHAFDWGLRAQNSTPMIDAFSRIVEQADVVIAHNGDSFDIKQLNTQRLLNGQSPIAWPTSEDTLKAFRKHFAFPSYRLDYLAKVLTGSGKDPMNFQDWIDIVENKSARALDKMIRYCKRDVRKLAAIFKAAEPHLKPKAHRGIISGITTKHACPRCASLVTTSKGLLYLASSVRQRRRCHACGHAFSVTRSSMV